jgi:hypothetical protein
MCTKGLTEHFRALNIGFTELHTKLDADTLLSFAIHYRQNKTQCQKRTYLKMMCVSGTLMQ